MWDGTTLTSPNGGSIALNEKAKKELDAFARKTNTDDETAPPLPPTQLWYADPAEYPHAYLAITEDTPGTVVVRDGNDQTGAAISFSRQQWNALTDPDGDGGLGEPEGDKKHPAEVRDPDDIHKTPARGGKNA